MTTNNTKLVEHFKDKPVTQLNWRELLEYNIALTFVEAQKVNGCIDCAIAAKHGITWECVEVKP